MALEEAERRRVGLTGCLKKFQLVIQSLSTKITGDVIPTEGTLATLVGGGGGGWLKWSFWADHGIHWLSQIRILLLRWLPSESLSDRVGGGCTMGKTQNMSQY